MDFHVTLSLTWLSSQLCSDYGEDDHTNTDVYTLSIVRPRQKIHPVNLRDFEKKNKNTVF